MKILVINGSPKGEASNTMYATRAFLAGMNEAAPQETEVIHLICIKPIQVYMLSIIRCLSVPSAAFLIF